MTWCAGVGPDQGNGLSARALSPFRFGQGLWPGVGLEFLWLGPGVRVALANHSAVRRVRVLSRAPELARTTPNHVIRREPAELLENRGVDGPISILIPRRPSFPEIGPDLPDDVSLHKPVSVLAIPAEHKRSNLGGRSPLGRVVHWASPPLLVCWSKELIPRKSSFAARTRRRQRAAPRRCQWGECFRALAQQRKPRIAQATGRVGTRARFSLANAPESVRSSDTVRRAC